MDRSKQLGEARVGKLLLKFSIPAIIGMLVNALYNIVDRVFIGRGVGTDAIAGITIGFPVMIIIMAFGMLIGLGATSLISIRLGEQKKEDAEHILGNAMVLLIGISIIITILGLVFLNPILNALGARGDVLDYSRQYLTIILAGSIFQSIGFGMNGFIRAEGNPKIAMMTMLIGGLINIALDPVFIFVFRLGIRGAAFATIFSQAISSIWVLYYYFGKKSLLKVHVKNFRLKLSVVGRIVAIGSAPFAMQIAASGIAMLFNKSLLQYSGDVAVSAYGIINSIALLILMPIFGINQGAQPIISYNYGAKQYNRVIKALKLAILAATSIVILGFIITFLFPTQLIGLFNQEDMELIEIGVNGIRIYLFMLPIIGFQIVSSNYFQAVGKPKHAMFLSLSRQVLFLIPAVLLLPRFYDLNGIWMAGPVSDVASSILTAVFLFVELKHLDFAHNNNLADSALNSR